MSEAADVAIFHFGAREAGPEDRETGWIGLMRVISEDGVRFLKVPGSFPTAEEAERAAADEVRLIRSEMRLREEQLRQVCPCPLCQRRREEEER
jgi:hypothetical protein